MDAWSQAVAGRTLDGIPDIGLLLVTTRDGRPVYVRDLAKIVIGPSPAEHHAWSMIRNGGQAWSTAPAVTMAFAKRAGANAVVVSDALVRRADALKGTLIPADVNVEITRDYGKTANDKANELLFHLALATVSIVLLIGFVIGWREAGVTLIVIPTTILLTLFAANLMGYTINRVSLFALIFSIGILVDDAIVVVENIARHWAMTDGRDRMTAAIEAVAEVGNPTVVATLTVVAALLPMLFVSGMMGPYMAPIPANASAAMLFSFFVAMVIAPWAMLKLSAQAAQARPQARIMAKAGWARSTGGMAAPMVASRRNAKRFLAVCRRRNGARLPAVRHQERHGQAAAVRQQVRAGGAGRPARRRDRRGYGARAVRARRAITQTLPEVTLNPGLCRHARAVQLQRTGAALLSAHPARAGRIAGQSGRQGPSAPAPAMPSRWICASALPRLSPPQGSVIKVVEVPPGPPVLSTLLAEIYGPDAKTRRAVAESNQGAVPVRAVYRRYRR